MSLAPLGQEYEALGRSRGGFSTKVRLRAERGGKLLVIVLSGGERHEPRDVEALRSAGRVRPRAQGRPRIRPPRVVGDRGYSYPTVRYPTVRRFLARWHIRAVIPRRGIHHPDDRRHASCDRVACRERNRVERLVNCLKQHRRVAARSDKRARHYLAMRTLVAALLWL